MLEIRQVPLAETTDNEVSEKETKISSADKVEDIFGKDELEAKTIQANTVAFGKKASEVDDHELVRNPLKIEEYITKSRFDGADNSGKTLSGRNFVVLVSVVVVLHIVFAFFIESSNKKPRFASTNARPTITAEPRKDQKDMMIETLGAPAIKDEKTEELDPLKILNNTKEASKSPDTISPQPEKTFTSPAPLPTQPRADKSSESQTGSNELDDTEIIKILNKTE